jgi:hypothetical protein
MNFPRSAENIKTREQQALFGSYASGALLRFIGDVICVFPNYAERLADDLNFLSEYHFQNIQRSGSV